MNLLLIFFTSKILPIVKIGSDLSDPENTVRLYQLMRSAREAVFDLERGEELLSITVSLDDTNIEQ